MRSLPLKFGTQKRSCLRPRPTKWMPKLQYIAIRIISAETARGGVGM